MELLPESIDERRAADPALFIRLNVGGRGVGGAGDTHAHTST